MGRILSYYDLCDLPYGYNKDLDKDLDFSEFMTEEEMEAVELKRQEREQEELRRMEEEQWLLEEELRRAKEEEEEERQRLRKIRIQEEERNRQKKRDSQQPMETAELFKEINKRRRSTVRPKSAQGNLSAKVIYARRGSEDNSLLGGSPITLETASVRRKQLFFVPFAVLDSQNNLFWLRLSCSWFRMDKVLNIIS